MPDKGGDLARSLQHEPGDLASLKDQAVTILSDPITTQKTQCPMSSGDQGFKYDRAAAMTSPGERSLIEKQIKIHISTGGRMTQCYFV